MPLQAPAKPNSALLRFSKSNMMLCFPFGEPQHIQSHVLLEVFTSSLEDIVIVLQFPKRAEREKVEKCQQLCSSVKRKNVTI